MKTIKDIYKIGKGPSSSHTMGPERICQIFRSKNIDATSFKVYLYGSLSKTGKGHGTDKVIIDTLSPIPVDVLFESRIEKFVTHPNTMKLEAYNNNDLVDTMIARSIGGGDIEIDGMDALTTPDIYELETLDEILKFCNDNNFTLFDYVISKEDESLSVYLEDVWHAMRSSIHTGLSKEGILPGGLNIKRKARLLLEKELSSDNDIANEMKSVFSLAYAVSEENADNGIVVTAPTCGSCGVVPAVLYKEYKEKNLEHKQVVQALATAGLIGNIIKTNASISGAECGCQAEIGSACAMAAAGLASIRGMKNNQVACAAEIALEHSLGLTCDPICGLVQVPCIERNAVAASRAIDACNLAYFITDESTISFDDVVSVLKETGKNMPEPYRETGDGGLAKIFDKTI